MSIALHTAFPVRGQADYVASVTTARAREELEEYIERLELDFGMIRGEDPVHNVREKMREADKDV